METAALMRRIRWGVFFVGIVGYDFVQIGLTIFSAYIDIEKNDYISLAKTCLVDWFTILPTLPYMYYFSLLSPNPSLKD